MFWLSIALASIVALVLWRALVRKRPPAEASGFASTRQPIQLTLTVTASDAARSAPKPQTDTPLEKDAWEVWGDELYAEGSREVSAEINIT